MTFNFCPNCGARLAASTEPFAPQTCSNCGQTHHHESKPYAGALIVRDRQLLLVKRAFEPFKGWWDIPGGFLEPGEHPRDGMLREVHEETGLSVKVREWLGVYVDRYDTRDGKKIYTLNHYYIVEPSGGTPRAADDAIELRWFPLDALPEQIAFEHARQVLRDLRERTVSANE